METITLRGSGGIELVADVDGRATQPPAVLLHGGGQTRHAWGTTLRELAAAGWYAMSVDLRGHGDSQWAPDGDYSIDAFSGDLVAIARTFDQLPVFVGASLGGLSSLVAVGESPEPIARALVLVDVAPRVEPDGAERIVGFMRGHLDGFASLDEVADAVSAYNPHRPRPSNLEGLKKNVRQRADGRWVWHWDPRFVSGKGGSPDETRTSMVEPRRLEDAARALTVPVLLVRGGVSDLLSERGVAEFLALVPHAQVADVAGAGHMVAGDRNDLFNHAVTSFLADLPD